jgi:hypothetical protein
LAEPVGIQFVIVNGVLVVENSQVTNALPGVVLRHNTTPRQQTK